MAVGTKFQPNTHQSSGPSSVMFSVCCVNMVWLGTTAPKTLKKIGVYFPKCIGSLLKVIAIKMMVWGTMVSNQKLITYMS